MNLIQLVIHIALPEHTCEGRRRAAIQATLTFMADRLTPGRERLIRDVADNQETSK